MLIPNGVSKNPALSAQKEKNGKTGCVQTLDFRPTQFFRSECTVFIHVNRGKFLAAVVWWSSIRDTLNIITNKLPLFFTITFFCLDEYISNMASWTSLETKKWLFKLRKRNDFCEDGQYSFIRKQIFIFGARPSRPSLLFSDLKILSKSLFWLRKGILKKYYNLRRILEFTSAVIWC